MSGQITVPAPLTTRGVLPRPYTSKASFGPTLRYNRANILITIIKAKMPKPTMIATVFHSIDPPEIFITPSLLLPAKLRPALQARSICARTQLPLQSASPQLLLRGAPLRSFHCAPGTTSAPLPAQKSSRLSRAGESSRSPCPTRPPSRNPWDQGLTHAPSGISSQTQSQSLRPPTRPWSKTPGRQEPIYAADGPANIPCRRTTPGTPPGSWD